jgi:hypothetical protein
MPRGSFIMDEFPYHSTKPNIPTNPLTLPPSYFFLVLNITYTRNRTCDVYSPRAFFSFCLNKGDFFNRFTDRSFNSFVKEYKTADITLGGSTG